MVRSHGGQALLMMIHHGSLPQVADSLSTSLPSSIVQWSWLICTEMERFGARTRSLAPKRWTRRWMMLVETYFHRTSIASNPVSSTYAFGNACISLCTGTTRHPQWFQSTDIREILSFNLQDPKRRENPTGRRFTWSCDWVTCKVLLGSSMTKTGNDHKTGG